MNRVAGIKKEGREKLALLIRGSKGVITVNEAANILGVTTKQASIILSRFSQNGWLTRIKRGIYITLLIEARDTDAVVEDAWIIANKLFAPCYISGWSALEYWGLTEQIFSTNLVITAKAVRNLSIQIKGLGFLLKVTHFKNFFGLKQIWRNDIKVQVSDPSRTIVDVLNDPVLAGGIRPVLDALRNYLASSDKDLALVINYADRLGNRTVFKRLGFLLEFLKVNEDEIITSCKKRLSSGNSKLDPVLNADCLVKRWRLWIPKDWRI